MWLTKKSIIDFNQFNTLITYDHFIGEYFVFDNIIELKTTLGRGHSIEEFLYMLEECDYNRIGNRRYVLAYTQSECELRVLKAFC